MDLPVRETVTEFADLVSADPQWVREEFDALIAASFSHPPATPLPPAPPAAPHGGRRQPPRGPDRYRLPACLTARFRRHGNRRQRSPPP